MKWSYQLLRDHMYLSQYLVCNSLTLYFHCIWKLENNEGYQSLIIGLRHKCTPTLLKIYLFIMIITKGH